MTLEIAHTIKQNFYLCLHSLEVTRKGRLHLPLLTWPNVGTLHNSGHISIADSAISLSMNVLTVLSFICSPLKPLYK